MGLQRVRHNCATLKKINKRIRQEDITIINIYIKICEAKTDSIQGEIESSIIIADFYTSFRIMDRTNRHKQRNS